MLFIAICDDDQYVVEKLESYLERIPNTLFEYDVFFDGIELDNYLQKSQHGYDIYLLDIEMKNMDGLTLARRLRKWDNHALIIFLTSYSNYVFDVFDVFTFDFVVKPITFERFKKVLDKAFSYLKIAKINFTFSYRKNSFSPPCDEIMYIDKSGRKAFIHTKEKTYQCNMTLDEIWKQLDTCFFASIHVSCIVNLSYVAEIVRDELTLKDGSKLFVGRNYRQKIKLKHLQFIRSQL